MKLLWIGGLVTCALAIVRITPPTFAVNAEEVKHWKFNTGDGDKRVYGKFHVNGTADGVQVVITNDRECEHWLARIKTSFEYNSGVVKDATVDVKLVKGGYCLIFDNRASKANKEVEADINIK